MAPDPSSNPASASPSQVGPIIAAPKLDLTSPSRAFAPFAAKMAADGQPPIAIHSFQHYFQQLVDGATGFIATAHALPVDDLPDAAGLDTYGNSGRAALDSTVIISLNGGLGTSMGMRGPKSLIPVREGLTFLDLLVRQVLYMRRKSGARLPLVLMSSFSTRDDSLAALSQYPDLESDVPLDFVQHRVPKVGAADLTPAQWPPDPEKTWCPPGHGDIYPALLSSGMLDALLDAGYEYAFVSNVDNLGAVLDIGILGYFAQERLPFLMEVADRTAADRKGGHLARRHDGGLVLRELAQCPPEEIDSFQDIARFRYFNTNNLWLHLPVLRDLLEERDGVLGLPLIRNEKPVDPTLPDSPRVLQLETAMGSAIGLIDGARAIRVSRDRFAPVKRCEDLLVLWSDVYDLDPASHVVQSAARRAYSDKPPEIRLDPDFYERFEDMRARFPYGAPSLARCDRFQVVGDVYFGRDVVILGDVRIEAGDVGHRHIPDGVRLSGEIWGGQTGGPKNWIDENR